VWQQDHASTANGASPYHFLHTDHLERPLAASDESGNATWQALSESFGKTYIEQGSAAQINLRLPGQYWDAETGTHYNQQRDYDPGKGRYIQSDPLGLYDGVNTFAYGYSNPLENIDPTGEAVPVWVYARCVAGCKAMDAMLAAVKSECDPRTLGDCMVECLNPFNWFGGSKARAVNRAKPPKLDVTIGSDLGPGKGMAKAPSKIDRKIFDKERKNYWKKEAENNSPKYSADDLARMKKGKAPTGPDGHPMELHHNDRTMTGGLTPMSRTDHRLGDNYKINHPN
jgi:RHS repeat-associated protein